ncbi:hypothetical protein EDEG_02592 [Edhazardia aedis USNM 41457]|uniref:RRM domain-containing protein n=1 Tax=Edhazardia aedis (strain USNM 41457) TaxID=1003232 RepID=J9DK75_EDHAE|nr:hypothetical protein EDEG_02592 [Edhazardia aedis USNM 41457]|eukprot:EJW03010.1 hypothetical protein EDEG_02592 [Edhazardia aedis USNM 41457]
MGKGCTVYVGNIDFDITEQELIEKLSSIGRVVNFKMMIDKQTGRSKGYGFCEYETPLIAETAVQKLKVVLNNRQLKINYADVDMSSSRKEIPQVSLPIESLKSVVDEMDKKNLKDVVLYLKKMAIEQPKKLRKILEENKSLAVSLFMCLVELKMVDLECAVTFMKTNFELNENEAQILERIDQMDDADYVEYNQSIKDKIKTVKAMISKASQF